MQQDNPTLITYTLPSRSKSPTHEPKLVKEYVIAIAFLPTLKTIFFGNSRALIGEVFDCNKLIMKKAQHTTRNIKNWAESGSYERISIK